MFVYPSDRGESQPLAANCPGGVARQYRVQCFDAASQSEWKLHATFREEWHARQCLADLQSRGIKARVVAYSALPTAA